jgi:hypothetical protein
MRVNRTLCSRIALLIAMLLPLQGVAAPQLCAAGAAAGLTMHAHCAPELKVGQHHGCGNCCCAAAIAPMPQHVVAPRKTPAPISVTVLSSAPDVTVDRLDRPPRFILL